jgi:hypothetical protein
MRFLFLSCMERSFAFGFFFDTLCIYGFWVGKKQHGDFFACRSRAALKNIHTQSDIYKHTYRHGLILNNHHSRVDHASHVR